VDWRVKWSGPALRDLDRTADHIAFDSKYYAGAFVREIRDAARSLRQLAQRGRIVPELEAPVIRELLVGNYRLIYHIGTTDVIILAVIHGARDLASLWKLEGRPTTPE
jgi:toxin ParE1/3/4